MTTPPNSIRPTAEQPTAAFPARLRPPRLSQLVLLAAGCWLLAGCMDPGPRALLKGEKLLQQGKVAQATEHLQRAVRLLPKTAQAHNLLGLAYHRNSQADPAQRCYRQALALDNNLAAARFNLGCLLLENNDLQGATDHLTSFTYLQPNAAAGWLKLGAAHLRARRFDAAEKAYRNAATLEPHNPEALNGLGSVQFHRRRVQEAYNYFNQALAEQPQYGPALLNAAIVAHQSLNNRPLALQLYRKYLALKPRPPQWDAISAAATQLDLELNPPPLALVRATPPTPPPPSQTTSQTTNLAARPLPGPDERPSLQAPAKPPETKTNPPLAPAPLPQPAQTASSPAVATPSTQASNTVASPQLAAVSPTNILPQPAVQPLVVLVNTNPTLSPPKPAPREAPASVPPTPVEVIQIPDELVINPAQDITPSAGTPAPLPAPAPTVEINTTPITITPSGAGTPPPLKPAKRSWITRFIPFRPKPKPATNIVTLVSPVTEKLPPTKPAQPPSQPKASPPAPKPPPVFPRYSHVFPSKPAGGDRVKAEPTFARGLKAHRAGDVFQALSEYQRATRQDPAYFEAWYNLGLANYEAGRWAQSLQAYEWALALKPDSTDARYNFALSLKQAGFARDSAEQLAKIIERRPEEARAHLSLANLHAYYLQQPKLAREHFTKVLELQPQHPQATDIRLWLASQNKGEE